TCARRTQPAAQWVDRTTPSRSILWRGDKRKGLLLVNMSPYTIIGAMCHLFTLPNTSQDPQYKAKIEAIKKILSELKNDEAFFSIDEFGPFAVKKTGGRKRVAPQENYTVPQWQKSKGHLIVTAALELSRNQVTHFYSEKKNTGEMIKMMDLLRTQYRNCKIIYLSWDAASWHISRELFSKINERNEEAPTHGYPVVRTAPASRSTISQRHRVGFQRHGTSDHPQ
ncbi:MAG TPA: hypothetical protein VG204_10915, partial [Terriglobia bacterium]|nr:hypothetical protein [Terriglobia bacterium]